MNESTGAKLYHERLWPNTWLYIMLLLLVPAVLLLFMPLNTTLGVVLAPLSYLLAAGFFTAISPVISVTETEFIAGRARIPLTYLGKVTPLDADQLSLALGIQADARAYLLIRGWIHQGLKIVNTDPSDPAPYWIVTSRNPEKLAQVLATHIQNK